MQMHTFIKKFPIATILSYPSFRKKLYNHAITPTFQYIFVNIYAYNIECNAESRYRVPRWLPIKAPGYNK